jgi:hypothetical protein
VCVCVCWWLCVCMCACAAVLQAEAWVASRDGDRTMSVSFPEFVTSYVQAVRHQAAPTVRGSLKMPHLQLSALAARHAFRAACA